MPRRAAALPFLALAAALPLAHVSPETARAYEDKGTVGVEAGYAIVTITDTDLPQHGMTFGVSGSIGIADVFSLRAHLAYAFHPGDDPLHVGLLGLEMLYLVDIVQLVPYFGLGIDGLGTFYQDSGGLELGFHVTAGAEYLVNRDILIGLDVRPHFLFPTIAEGRLEPVYLTVTARISFFFDM